MAAICPVCNEEITFGGLWSTHTVGGFEIHDKDCILKYRENPEKYGAISVEQRGEVREEKSVYIKGGINVESFDMPFGDMVIFMVKWSLASIPAFIILFIIFGIFFLIFGSLFF